MSVRRWSEGSAAAILICSEDPALQYIAFTDLHADRPREQPGRETISCSANLIRLPQCALPHRRHSPSVFEEFCTKGAVPSDVRVELRLPELRPGCWGGGVATALVTMPEAAVDEHHGAVLRKPSERWLAMYASQASRCAA